MNVNFIQLVLFRGLRKIAGKKSYRKLRQLIQNSACMGCLPTYVHIIYQVIQPPAYFQLFKSIRIAKIVQIIVSYSQFADSSQSLVGQFSRQGHQKQGGWGRQSLPTFHGMNITISNFYCIAKTYNLNSPSYWVKTQQTGLTSYCYLC